MNSRYTNINFDKIPVISTGFPILYEGKPFSGTIRYLSKSTLSCTHGLSTIIKGVDEGIYFECKVSSNEYRFTLNYRVGGYEHGYYIHVHNKRGIEFTVYDLGIAIECKSLDTKSRLREKIALIEQEHTDEIFNFWIEDRDNQSLERYNLHEEDNYENINYDKLPIDKALKLKREHWALRRTRLMKEGYYEGDKDFLPYYNLQNEMREKVIKEDRLPSAIKYIAGVDVAYHEVSQKMVGGIVVLDAETLEVVETALHEMEISFPYIPGLFSFREIPPLLEAYKKLNIKPDLIVCDAHGIAHPMGVGMATHLGIELDIPTIGCAKKRLVGYYDKEALGTQRGDSQSLIWDSQEVGKALRTQDNIKPMFVSIGHKISLETACEWVLKLCPNYRLPETTRAVDHLVNQVLKERTDFNVFPEDDNEEAF